ncbi:MAG: hypothetical protein R2852_07515 [Bacteroidia bacterium]
MKFRIYLVCFLSVYTIQTQAQNRGCTDYLAQNFNPNATVNDGSCTYNTSSVTPFTICQKISDSLVESSGLIYFNNMFWSINDSNNPPFLYAFDSISGQILHQTYISNAVNNDWEDITHDDQYIYIGDFGNNGGNRKNLQILKIDKSDLNMNQFSDSVSVGFIRFNMSDQTNFNNSGQNHNYDMEAICVLDDSLHLFSKNWVDATTRHYVCPRDTGTYSLDPQETLEVGGLITGACKGSDSRIVLTGYNKSNYGSFIVMMWNYKSNRFLSGNRRRVDVGNLISPGQNEAVCLIESALYMSNEKKINEAQLHRIETSKWINQSNLSSVFNPDLKAGIKVLNLSNNEIEIKLSDLLPGNSFYIYDSSGRLVYSKLNFSESSFRVDTEFWAASMYYLFANNSFIEKILIRKD